MICPKCLAPKTLKMFVDVTIECPGDQSKLDKKAMRDKNVQIIAVNWSKTRYFCIECGYTEKFERRITE